MTMDHQLHARLVSACSLSGLDPAGARLLHNYSNAIIRLPAEDALVRITVGPADLHRVRLTQDITAWLARSCRFPATAPFRNVEAVVVDGGAVASFWEYHRQPAILDYTSADLAGLLLELHRTGSDGRPGGLPQWQALTSLEAALEDGVPETVLPPEELAWLKDEIAVVRAELSTVDWDLPAGLIHGDAWAGNLLADGHAPRLLLGDWDWVSSGPREVDLVPTWHAARRYGRDSAWTSRFAETYGYDLSISPGFETLMHMRDLVQLTGPLRHSATQPRYLQALRQRIEGIRSGDREEQWKTM